MSIEFTVNKDVEVEISRQHHGAVLICPQDYNLSLFRCSESDNGQLVAQGFPNPVITGSAQGRGDAHGVGRFDGCGGAYGEGTVSGTGYAVHRARDGHLRVEHGTGTVSGRGFVYGTGSGEGTGSAHGHGVVNGTGSVRHHHF
jgi:hypothetical protein